MVFLFANPAAPTRHLLVRLNETTSGPVGGQKGFGCLEIYDDGQVSYFHAARWDGVTFQDQNGHKVNFDSTRKTQTKLEEYEVSQLREFLKTKDFKSLDASFPPPHTPIDYFEATHIEAFENDQLTKAIDVREFRVASMVERQRYPASLLILMNDLEKIEERAVHGTATDITPACAMDLTPTK